MWPRRAQSSIGQSERIGGKGTMALSVITYLIRAMQCLTPLVVIKLFLAAFGDQPGRLSLMADTLPMYQAAGATPHLQCRVAECLQPSAAVLDSAQCAFAQVHRRLELCLRFSQHQARSPLTARQLPLRHPKI